MAQGQAPSRKQAFPSLLGFHSGTCMLQMGQEAFQNLGPPAFCQNICHRHPVHKVLQMPWKALEMSIFASPRDPREHGSLGVLGEP